MCHLLLLLPIIALPVFWIWPMSVAVPVYAVASGISFAAYAAALKAMRRPVLTGREHMLGAKGQVVSTADGHMTAMIDGELWTATSDRELTVDDEVSVISLEGLKLRVEPVTAE